MSNGLKIQSGGALDLVSLGALVHRLDPGVIPSEKRRHARFTRAAENSMSPQIWQIVFV